MATMGIDFSHCVQGGCSYTDARLRQCAHCGHNRREYERRLRLLRAGKLVERTDGVRWLPVRRAEVER